MKELLTDELLKDEEILWYSKPEKSVIFSRGDIFLIPFSLLWGGFAMFWEFSAVKMGAPFFFCLFGIPFVLTGLYFIFGRFIYKSIKKNNTYYAITNKRVLIITDLLNKSLQAEFISQIPCINKSVRLDGVGTIKFGNTSFFSAIYGNSGMEFLSSRYANDVPTFYDIVDVELVYKLVDEIRQK